MVPRRNLVKSIAYRRSTTVFFSYAGQIFVAIFLEMSNAATPKVGYDYASIPPGPDATLAALAISLPGGIGNLFVSWNKNIFS